MNKAIRTVSVDDKSMTAGILALCALCALTGCQGQDLPASSQVSEISESSAEAIVSSELFFRISLKRTTAGDIFIQMEKTRFPCWMKYWKKSETES